MSSPSSARSWPRFRERLKPEALILLMIAALFGVGALAGGGGGDDDPAAPALAVDVERVARDLEEVRGLRFRDIPPVRVVSPAEAKEEALALLDAEYPAERRETDTRLLELLGLLPPGSDLRELAGTIFGEEVAGYYDTRAERMTVVAEGLERDEEFGELIIAHELTHALEDQHYGLETQESQVDDEAAALTALHEGTATVAMFDYAVEHLGGGAVRNRDEALRALRLGTLLGNEKLPPYLQRALVFPYVEGARFVDTLGPWEDVDGALSRPPVSTEQILHPSKYRARERPLRVPVPPRPGPGWARAASGTIGEFDTGELIRASDSPVRAQRAAAGWGGGSYALWQKDGKSIVALAWRWDTRRDAAEFVAALPRYIERALDGRPARVDVGPTVRLTIGPAE